MTQSNSPNTGKRKILSARRLALLASVAGLGIAVVVAGPSSYRALRSPP